MKQFVDNMDKTEPRQSYQYGITESQFRKFDEIRVKLSEYQYSIEGLCKKTKSDINYGFKLGLLWTEISKLMFEVMELERTIEYQKDL